LTSEEKQIIAPWLKTPIDSARIRQHYNNLTAVFSTNDPYVPLENGNTFKEKLGAKIVTKKNKGHFDESSGAIKLPIALFPFGNCLLKRFFLTMDNLFNIVYLWFRLTSFTFA